MKSKAIRAALMRRGHTLDSWAESRGYRPATVRQTVGRWVTHKGDRTGSPRGMLTHKILADLAEDTGLPLIEREAA